MYSTAIPGALSAVTNTAMPETMMNYEEARKKMSDIGQEHVFLFFDELSDAQKRSLIQQIAETDFSVLRRINHGAGDGRGVFAPLDECSDEDE